MRKVGSQLRHTLKDAGLVLVMRPAPGEVIVRDEDGKAELWRVNDRHSGYTLQIGRWGYEFVRTVARPGEGFAI